MHCQFVNAGNFEVQRKKKKKRSKFWILIMLFYMEGTDMGKQFIMGKKINERFYKQQRLAVSTIISKTNESGQFLSVQIKQE